MGWNNQVLNGELIAFWSLQEEIMEASMEIPEGKSTLRQNVRDVLGLFKAGDIDLEATTTYLMEIIEAGEPARFNHVINLRAHD